MNYTLSPNMNLLIPTVGVDPGPEFAQDINNSLTLVDGHNHSSGYGVQINPAGININADLPFNNNNLTATRSLRMSVQSTAEILVTDLNQFYDLNGDAYFIDGSGNQIRLTQGGGIAGPPGSITGMTPPAYVHYDVGTQTFTFGSDSTTPANIDVGFINLRNNVSNSHKLQLLPPPGMTSDIDETLPFPPVQPSIMTMDSTGAMGTSLITQDLLAPRSTASVASAGQIAISNSSGSFSTGATSATPVTNLSVTLTTLGRPVEVFLQPVLTSGSVDANTVLLLHCDGSNGATSFPDSGVNSHGVTASGTAQVSTSIVQFGTGSLSTTHAGAGSLDVSGTTADWAFGTGDFTIDFWLNFTPHASGITMGIMTNASASLNANNWYIQFNAGSGGIDFGTSGGPILDVAPPGGFNDNQWYHIAIVRASGVTTPYFNGIHTTNTSSVVNLSDNFNTLTIGDTPFGPSALQGFMDEIRISNIARWTSNFTPPIAPYGSASAPSSIGVQASSSAQGIITIYRDGSPLVPVQLTSAGGTSVTLAVPPGSVNYLDPVIAGTHTYAIFAQAVGSSTTTLTDVQLVAYEI